MRERPYDGQSLFGPSGYRKYLNACERRRFLESAQQLPTKPRLFCLMLTWSGARISEVLALTPAGIDIESGVASIETLKRRRRGIVRQVPLPSELLRDLNRAFKLRIAQRDPQLSTKRLWSWSRTTAWRYVEAVMAMAGIIGAPAMYRRISCSAGSGTPRPGRHLYMATLSAPRSAPLPPTCGRAPLLQYEASPRLSVFHGRPGRFSIEFCERAHQLCIVGHPIKLEQDIAIFRRDEAGAR